LPKPKAPDFETAADDFLQFLFVQKGEGETYRRNLYGVKPIKEFFGKRRADKITMRDVESFISWRKNQTSIKTSEKIQNDTISKELSILSRIFNRLKKGGSILKNPVEDVESLPANNPDFHVLTPSEEKIYLMACPPIL